MQDEDDDLFRKEMEGVDPLPDDDRVRVRPEPPAPVASRSRAMREALLEASLDLDPADLDTESGEELLFQRGGIDRNRFRRLRRGQIPVEAELDLHGENLASATAMLSDFMNAARDRGLRSLRIVHGKGRRSSSQGPVIKPMVDRVLRRRDEVLAFCSARPEDGGTGAVYVLLRRR